MIKINLLPIKQDRRREAGRNQLLFGVALLILEGVACALLFFDTNADVTEQRNANEGIQAQVKRIEKQLTDHKRILAEIAEFEKRQEAIDNLQAARTGPIYVMLELSNILSKGGRPHINHDEYQEMIQANPTAGYDENWDFRRVWLSSFKEKDRQVQLAGQGLTHEDVAEFLRRINLSKFFVETELVSTNLQAPRINLEGFDAKEADPVVQFVMKSEIRYR
jgi:type IV pilus assembly protein PilN